MKAYVECSIKNRYIFVNNVAKVVAQRLIKGYNDPKIIRNSSGQGEIPIAEESSIYKENGTFKCWFTPILHQIEGKQ